MSQRRPATGRAPAPLTLSTRERVFAAATELIAEQGFAGTTVDEIAARAGVAKGTVFYQFGSKEHLFEELLRHGVDRLLDRLRQAVEGRHGWAALEALVRAELEGAAEHLAFIQVFLAELFRTGRPWRPTLLELRGRATGMVHDVLLDGQRLGELDPGLDAEFAAGALLGAVAVVALDWLTYSPGRSLDDVHAAAVRMVRGRVGAA
ncbi:MAG TPA: helix-turn-helix domain-containing protein [Kineosporiaceae bacterium]